MRLKKLIVSIVALTGAVVLTGLFVVAVIAYNNMLFGHLYYAKGLAVYIVVYLGLLLAVSKLYGGFEVGTFRIFEVAFSCVLSIAFVNIITYLQISLIAKGFLDPDYMIALSLVQFLFAVIWTITSDRIYRHLFHSSHMLLIYGRDYPTGLIAKLKENDLKYHLNKTMDETAFANVGPQLDSEDFQDILIYQVTHEFGAVIKEYCFEKNIRLYIVPEIADILINHADRVALSDSVILLCRNDPMTITQEAAKRLMDMLFSAIMLLALMPFMVIAALAIRLGDGGPVFYKQTRLTRNGKLFVMYKFRSMINDAEPDGRAKLAQKQDHRITGVGKVIRKIRFDEIPQFFNVLKGDMSVVGPRPERPEIARQYEEEMPEFSYRLKMKAGITGYAQVYGRYNTTPKDKLTLDIIYVNSYSLLLDIRLILMTIKIIFLPGKTEGVQ